MIKFENVEVVGWEHAIRGMRNPLNSWDKSDSEFKLIWLDNMNFNCGNDKFSIGDKDLNLMKKLSKAGTDHRKFMRMITVYADVTAPLYWWKEFDTYKVGTVANSCSTMHKIHDKEFSLFDFSFEHLYDCGLCFNSLGYLKNTINILNFWRERYNETDEERNEWFKKYAQYKVPSKKECWWQMIQLLPSSYNQKRTVMLNYEVLANIYKSRNNHKLDEWKAFCKWIKRLLYNELITGEYDHAEE